MRLRRRWQVGAALAVALAMATAGRAGAQGPDGAAQTPSGQPSVDPLKAAVTVTVVGTTPLPGVEVPEGQVPSPVQTATDRDLTVSGAQDLSDFLNRRLNGVHVNGLQGNAFQPDVNYRGYTASPLLGTPQGLSVYLDGVRLNQPFGDVVNWDLIPRMAVASTTLMPGSNPLFGLNTLGGALSVQTKDGHVFQGSTVQATLGSHVRRALEFEHGDQTASQRFTWYLAGSLFGDRGWREESPSDVRQLFGKVGWRRERDDFTVSAGFADNVLNGNGLQEVRLLARDYTSVYTKPDTTTNRSSQLTVTNQHQWDNGTTALVQAYYRHLRTGTVNGDLNEGSLDQSVYQPSAAERAALAAAGFGTIPASGLTSANTPFPFLRCVGNVLLGDEPAEKCNGIINRTHTLQGNGGLSGQVTRRRAVGAGVNTLTAGMAFDASSVSFTQSAQLGYLNPDRSVTGLNAYGDGVSGGSVDGVPFDSRIDLDSTVTTLSLYLTDTMPLGSRAHLTLSGRYNRTVAHNRDRIEPANSPASLTGDHAFSRLNPSAGITVTLSPAMNLYGSYGEGSRAATAIELGCANPAEPCKLPNAMAGDPPLDQVVTRTVEAGLRGTHAAWSWHVGAFRAENQGDILFVTSQQTGLGYFRNFGKTQRVGLEASARAHMGRATLGADYTFLRATFESAEVLLGSSNSTNSVAAAGQPGLDGSISISPGNRIPLVPQHMLKVYADLQATSRLSLDVDMNATGGSFARGNENNRHQPDGLYYLGSGESDGYAVVNAGARYRLTKQAELVAQVSNLLNREYATGAQLGPTGITPQGQFLARPFPAVNGEYPLSRSTFLAPGAPRLGWAGLRLRF